MKPLLILLFCGIVSAQENPRPDAKEYQLRLTELQDRNKETPNDPDILEALAGSYAMGGRYSEAIAIMRQWIALDPANPALHVRVANYYAWSGDVDRAIAELRNLQNAGPDALELQCRLLSWKRDAQGAAQCYAKLRQATSAGSPQQVAAELGRARNLAWSGRSGAAVKAYRAYNAAVPADTAMDLEFARLLLYQGRYSEAEKVVSAVISSHPDDAIALSLKAEILHWAGHRSHEAARLSDQALARRPGLPEAQIAAVYAQKDLGNVRAAAATFRSLDGYVRVNGIDRQASYAGAYQYLREQAPDWSRVQIQAPFSEYNDSDGIHESMRGVQVAVPLGNNGLLFRSLQYQASAPAQSIFGWAGRGERVAVYSAGAAFHLAPNIQLESSGGTAWYQGGPSQGIFSVALNGSPVDRWMFHLSADRNVVPVTPRTIAIGLAETTFRAGVEHYFDSRTSLQLDAQRGFWNDGNKSVLANAQLQRILRYSKRLMIDAGPRARFQSFARNMTYYSGLLTPDLYQSYEGVLGVHGELKRFTYELRPAAGEQRLWRNVEFEPSWEFAASLKFRVSRELTLSANYDRRNYNVLTGGGSYQGFYLQLGLEP